MWESSALQNSTEKFEKYPKQHRNRKFFEDIFRISVELISDYLCHKISIASNQTGTSLFRRIFPHIKDIFEIIRFASSVQNISSKIGNIHSSFRKHQTLFFDFFPPTSLFSFSFCCPMLRCISNNGCKQDLPASAQYWLQLKIICSFNYFCCFVSTNHWRQTKK